MALIRRLHLLNRVVEALLDLLQLLVLVLLDVRQCRFRVGLTLRGRHVSDGLAELLRLVPVVIVPGGVVDVVVGGELFFMAYREQLVWVDQGELVEVADGLADEVSPVPGSLRVDRSRLKCVGILLYFRVPATILNKIILENLTLPLGPDGHNELFLQERRRRQHRVRLVPVYLLSVELCFPSCQLGRLFRRVVHGLPPSERRFLWVEILRC